MILVDTCGWVEWLTDGVLAERYAPFMARPSELLVPTTVHYELYKWVKREFGEAAAQEAIALADDSMIAPLTQEIALMAGDITLRHKLAFADAVIYASAQKYQAELVTSDDHFDGMPGVTYFPKKDC